MSHASGCYEYMEYTMKSRYGDSSAMVGILFANPRKTFVKDEILNMIKYDNERSGLDIDFFFAGYSKLETDDPDEIVINAPKNGQKWHYNERIFTNFINHIHDTSEWKYSGETELLLLDFREGELHFDKSLVIWLDRAVRDRSIYSVSNLFENIYRIVRSKGNTRSLIDELCAFLNDNRGNSNIFKVEDLSKK